MEAALHSQVGSWIAGTLALAAVCGCLGCEPTVDSTVESAVESTVVEPPPQAKRPEAKPADAIRAVLKRCHGVLMGRENMANSWILLSRTAADERPEDVRLGAGGAMRVRRGPGRIDVCLPDRAWRIADDEVLQLEGKAEARLRRFQGLLRAALLEPLYAAKTINRQGPNIYQLIMTGGATWRLELQEVRPPDGAPVLLPFTLEGPNGKLTFEEHLHTGITHLPKKVVLGEFGRRWFSLKLSGIVYTAGAFTDPAADVTPTRTPIVRSEAIRPELGVVRVMRVRASRSLVVQDPGSWSGRVEAWKECGTQLGRQGQGDADLEFYFDEGGKRRMAIPFEMRSDGKPFVATAEQRILRIPAQTVAVVRTEGGTLDACEKAAGALLDQHVAGNRLKVAGPLRTIPFVMLNKGGPSEQEQQNLKVRFELPVRE